VEPWLHVPQAPGTVTPALVGTAPPCQMATVASLATYQRTIIFWGFSPALCPRRSSGKTSDGLRFNISTISAMRLWTTHSIDNMAKTNPNQQVRPEAATAAASLLGPRPNQMMGLLNLLDHDPAVSGDGTYGAYDAGSQSKGTLTMINNTISTSYQTLLPTSWT